MKVYLHVGTEKTGSSYIQKLCGVNRDVLRGAGVLFPSAGRDEHRLIHGSISPGNARELSDYLVRGHWDGVRRWLESRIRMGSDAGCTSILLSHELLFVAIAQCGDVNKFVDVARRAGAAELHALLVVRNPVDQAVSLYKHRAKNGRIDDVSHWIRDKYTVAEDIAAFLRSVSGSELQLTVRKYGKNSGYLERIFFRDWLGLSQSPEMVQESTNPSLTHSELRVIRRVAQTQPAAVEPVYRRFLAIPPKCKANDEHLEALAQVEVANHVRNFNEIWEEVDALLSPDGGLDWPANQTTLTTTNRSICLSDDQFKAVYDSYIEAARLTNRFQFWLVRGMRSFAYWVRAKAMRIFGTR